MKSTRLLLLVVVYVGIGVCQGADLRKKFYKVTCPSAEDIVKSITSRHVSTNANLPAKLLRLHFHDCMVRGCDASVLISSTANNSAEQDAISNSNLAGFDVIDEIKAQLEKTCPGVVSCADILALATRDSVSFQFQKPLWDVLTGRRDGRVSVVSEALANIPGPFQNFNELKQMFNKKGLTVHDLVVLSGAHTIGSGHCNIFSNRLYNFTGRGDQDPSLDPTYATFLKTKCPTLTDSSTVEMDPESSQNFDNNYYKILSQNKGIFQSDAALLTDKGARKTVLELTGKNAFITEFAQSIRKVGAIGVLTGVSGEIRKQCSIIN